MSTNNNLYISSADNTIEIKSEGLSLGTGGDYSGEIFHSFAKGSFRIAENNGVIKLLFPAFNSLPIWKGKLSEIFIDGAPTTTAAFKTYTQQNFYSAGVSINRLNIPSSTTNQQFAIGAGGWLVGVSIFPDGGFDGEVKIGTTPGGDDLSADSTYAAGQDTTNTIVEHFPTGATIYITNITGKPITYNILKG